MMDSTEQTIKKRNDDVDNEISYVGKNRFKGLPIKYKMASTKQMMEKSQDDNIDDEMSHGEKIELKDCVLYTKCLRPNKR